jgi:hypothetical protein
MMQFKKAQFKDLSNIEAMFINPYETRPTAYVGLFAIDEGIRIATITKIETLKGDFDLGTIRKRYYYKVSYIDRKENRMKDKDFPTLKEAKEFCQQLGF